MIAVTLAVLAAAAPAQASEIAVPLMLTGLGMGFAVGFWTGRRWAERGRARFDGRGAMQRRQDYRGMGPFWPFNK
jgi:hypothetical protein